MLKILQNNRISYNLISFDSEFEDSIADIFSEANAGIEGSPFDFDSIEKKEAFEKIFVPFDFSSQNNEEFSHKAINQDEIKKKRGRRRLKKVDKATHGNKDFDNLQRKIQVHFLSFLTNYVNDIIRVFIEDNNLPLFKNIDYKIKKNVKYKNVQELKSKTIGEIIQLRVSPKMKNHDDSVNKNIYNKVCSLSPFMYFYLQRSYLSLFKEYFYNKNKVFTVNGKIIPLSIKTRCFTDLINKNYSYKEKLKYVAVNYFLNNHTRYKK